MINQYGAQRFRWSVPLVPMTEIRYRKRGKKITVIPGKVQYVPQPQAKRIGTVPIGTILYIQDRLGRFQSPIRRNPWIVLAWLNRKYFPCVAGAPDMTYMAGGHLALVKSLRDGRTQLVGDHFLFFASDAGLEKQ